LLGHNNALGQGYVLSNGGSIGLTSGVVLPSLRVDGSVTTTSAITTTGNQTYNGALTFMSGGTPTPARVANFESTQGDIAFMGTVSAGVGSKAAERSLVVSALNGQATINEQVGLNVVDTSQANFATQRWSQYAGATGVNPWAVDIEAERIALNANVTSFETQLYKGATLIGNNGLNGFNRMLISLDPAITFIGSVDDTAKGQHSLILRAISLVNNEVPSIQLGSVGQINPLASLDILTGRQMTQGNPFVAEISLDRTQYVGQVVLKGSVATVGDQTYVGRSIDLDSSQETIVLKTETGVIEAITGIDAGASVSITGLNNTRIERGPRARGAGSELRANARAQGQTLNEKIVGRLPSEEAEQTGSGMVSALKRSIDRIQTRQPDLDDMLDLNGLASAGGEVSIGALQDVSATPMAERSSASGATQIDCDVPSVAQLNPDECRTINQD
jgi:hypothetical protein